MYVPIREHRRGGVERDDALAALDEVEQRLLLLRRERLVVAVDHQRVVVRQLFGGSASAGVYVVSWMPRRASGAPIA